MARFKLAENFLEEFKEKTPPFGYEGLGEFVYNRTYSRIKDDGTKEQWWETCARVVEFVFEKQRQHVNFFNTGWNAWKAQKSAQEMFKRMFELKWTPPGRGLWAAGTKITDEKELYAALNNCAFVSTIDMLNDPVRPFLFLMDMSMLGVGVGFDLKGAGSVLIKGFNGKHTTYVVPDTREGWVDSIRILLENGFSGKEEPVFDYSEVRKAGEPIKVFGGVSSGSGPLEDAHDYIKDIILARAGERITERDIADIMNILGQAVISGNVRRSAEIILSEPTEEYLNLKNYNKNPERAAFGWTSNNSVILEEPLNDYSRFTEHIQLNGEPGFAWMSNMQKFSRMNDVVDNKDKNAVGTNPCAEQTLESFELCTLVETFPHKHETYEDYKQTLKYAYLYAKTITLLPTHWPETNAVLMKNRRIGCSVSGIAQAIAIHGIEEFRQWMEKGYQEINNLDEIYSNWLAIPQSIKKTSVKPSGTVSLLAGATPGVHLPVSQYYIRRVRVSKFSDLLPALRDAGYHIEDDVMSPNTTVVVEFPIKLDDGVRTLQDSNLWEQLELAAFMQRWWADNQVSCTVTFTEDEAKELPRALQLYQYRLKSISFFPKGTKEYAQAPYEPITEALYKLKAAGIKKLKLNTGLDALGEKFCDGDMCVI